MTKRKSKPQIMWMIKDKDGRLISGTNARQRKTAQWLSDGRWRGLSWKECYALGQRAVKVEIREIK